MRKTKNLPHHRSTLHQVEAYIKKLERKKKKEERKLREMGCRD
jgi:hypothetical protein